MNIHYQPFRFVLNDLSILASKRHFKWRKIIYHGQFFTFCWSKHILYGQMRNAYICFRIFQYPHCDLFWEFWVGWSLGLKTLLYGVILFVHDCLITHLSWKILLRPKRSNLKWLWFFILYLIFSYENSATYEQLSVKKSKVFIGGTVFIWKYELQKEKSIFSKILKVPIDTTPISLNSITRIFIYCGPVRNFSTTFCILKWKNIFSSLVLVKTSETVKILNFDKLQSPKFNSFKDMTGFLRLNYENINLQKDIRNSRCLIIDSSLFHSNQMKIRKIDHSVMDKPFLEWLEDFSKSDIIIKIGYMFVRFTFQMRIYCIHTNWTLAFY